MKRALWLMLLPLAAVLVVACWVGFPGESAQAAAPPLPVEKYLHEKLPEATEKKVELKVDNQACYVCHGNYEGEELVVSHGTEEIGCMDCHGKSFAHRNDEDNITPPDKMYAMKDIDKMCHTCHDTHDAPARKVLERWHERCPAKTSPEVIVCTDCHYQHRLERRVVRWDKRTGELIMRSGSQRTKLADAVPEPCQEGDGDADRDN